MAAASTTPRQIGLMLHVVAGLPDPYPEFTSLIARGIDWCAQEMAKGKNNLQGQSENQLTQHITTALKAMGFDACHDANVGGHCDLTVNGAREMLWLGEAKIHGAYAELLGGYRQLMSRYSTGGPDQDRGGMLIYIYQADAKAIQDAWREYLEQSHEADRVWLDTKNDLVFYSSTKHPGSGRPMEVRHVPVLLFHKPTEDEPKPKRQARDPKCDRSKDAS